MKKGKNIGSKVGKTIKFTVVVVLIAGMLVSTFAGIVYAIESI